MAPQPACAQGFGVASEMARVSCKRDWLLSLDSNQEPSG
jgi:hypothetical protein